MKENGINLRTKNMGEAGKYGKTVVSMKDGGNKVKLVEGADLSMLKGTSIPDIGLMTRPMVTENTPRMMAQRTKDNGWKMRNTVKVLKNGPKVSPTKETIKMDINRVLANSPCQMEPLTKAISNKMNFAEKG